MYHKHPRVQFFFFVNFFGNMKCSFFFCETKIFFSNNIVNLVSIILHHMIIIGRIIKFVNTQICYSKIADVIKESLLH